MIDSATVTGFFSAFFWSIINVDYSLRCFMYAYFILLLQVLGSKLAQLFAKSEIALLYLITQGEDSEDIRLLRIVVFDDD